MGAGRPSKLTDEKIYIAAGMASMGAIDDEIAEKLGITVRTIQLWRKDNEELFRPIKSAKEEADEKVERSLFQLATGYEHTVTKPMVVAQGDGVSAIEYAEYTEKIAPNTTAMIFWLKNRQPAKWRDKQEHELSGSIGVTIVDDIGK